MSGSNVSFIVPVHNGAAYLSECIKSVLGQTIAPREVIVVDDESTDDSAKIAESFGTGVRCIRIKRGGQAAARNIGVSVAEGQFVAFLDADDIAHRLRLEKQLACFSARPELRFCTAYAKNFWSPEILPEQRIVNPLERFTHGDDVKPNLIITWLVRRELFDEYGEFESGRVLGEDTEWRGRIEDSGEPTELLNAVLAYRRLHHGNLTRTRYKEYLSEIVKHSKQQVGRSRIRRG